MRFNGSDYIPQKDDIRLASQHERVKRALILRRSWLTLEEISEITGDPQASISAQLRHLRKDRFGGWVVEKRARGQRENGLFEYRLQPKGYVSEYVITRKMDKHRQVLREVYQKFPQSREFIVRRLGELK